MLAVLFAKLVYIPSYYNNLVPCSHFRQYKESDICTIICPGLGLFDILDKRFPYSSDSYGDVIALSYASMLDIPIKYLWIELWDEYQDYKELTSPPQFLPEAYMCLMSHVFYYLEKSLFINNDTMHTLLTPKKGLPIIPKRLNPTYLSHIGSQWPHFHAAKVIIRKYLDSSDYSQHILNLRGSLLRSISFALTQSYDQINIIGVEPEKCKYFFEEDAGIDLIPPSSIILPRSSARYISSGW